MDLCNYSTIMDLLHRHHFHFSKSKGQNFLTAAWVPQSIAEAAGLTPDHGVLEIGPGIGSLTQSLCDSAGMVASVEVDPALAPILKETMADRENFRLVMGDILKTDLAAFVRQQFTGLIPVACANLPYYITTPVLTRLLESGVFTSVTVMVQKEVAERICAGPGNRDYSAFSVFCQYYGDPVIQFDVPPDCFVPAPKVTSSVVTITIHPDKWPEIQNPEQFFRIVRGAFSQRRKTLLNALSSALPSRNKSDLACCISLAGFSPSVRGETLSIPDYIQLTKALFPPAE